MYYTTMPSLAQTLQQSFVQQILHNCGHQGERTEVKGYVIWQLMNSEENNRYKRIDFPPKKKTLVNQPIDDEKLIDLMVKVFHM